jgi:hypothetical protein
MRKLASSMVQFSWALSVFGAQQMVDALMPSPRQGGRRRSSEAFRTVTQSMTQQFSDATQFLFRTGDVLQQGTLDQMFPPRREEGSDAQPPGEILRNSANALFQGMQGLLSQPVSNPLTWGYSTAQTNVTQALLPPVARFISLFIPGREGRLAWTEFKNKFEVFELVQRTSSLLHIGSGEPPALPELVQRAYKLGPYPALWGLEGLGKFYADTYWQRGETPDQILSRNNAGDLPSSSLPMLHAGMGLSFATHLFAPTQKETQSPAIERTLRQFLTLCQKNSRPGYKGAAIESLGLVLRELYQNLILPVDGLLGSLDEESVAYFWHGVGRAIYFSPTNFLPSLNASWRALEMCKQEAPHALGQMNCRAGLGWAVTLVNLRHPEIMEGLLRQQCDQLADDDSFAAGVGGALILRYDTTPQDPSLSAFCGHQVTKSPALAECWRSQVSWPCKTGLHTIYPRLRTRHKLDDIFRYKPQTSAREAKAAA